MTLPGGLSAADMAQMQAALEEWMTDTCQILRATKGRSSGGGETLVWPPSGPASKCRVRPDRRAVVEKDAQGQEKAMQGWRITLSVGTDVTTQDRIRFGTRTFEILAVHGPKSMELTRQAVCKELT